MTHDTFLSMAECGKNAAIVCADTDLGAAAAAIAAAAFACAGQGRISTSRVFVQREVWDRFVALLAERCNAMRVGDPMDGTTDIGPVAGPSRLRVITEAIAKAKAERIDAGLAHVNLSTTYKDPSLPFGVWKESGFGPPENGRFGFEFFVKKKAVYMRRPAG